MRRDLPDRSVPSEITKDRNVLWKQKTPKSNSSRFRLMDVEGNVVKKLLVQ